MNLITVPEAPDLGLREQLAQRGIESSSVLQRRYDDATLAHFGRLRGRPIARAGVDAIEVIYLDIESIELDAS